MTGAARVAPRLDFLLGRADDLRAEAYVRLSSGPVDARITGTLTGPNCSFATTLPSTMPLEPLAGPGPAVARTIVTEPSYWTPELPNLYELTAEAEDATGGIVKTRRLVGLRRLGIRGRSIWLDGRRWVPRGVAFPNNGDAWSSFHADALVAVVVDPSPAACAAADAAGVGIIARLGSRPTDTAVAAQIGAWSQHPSVVMVVLDAAQMAMVSHERAVTGTMLIGFVVDAGDPPPPGLPPGADCLVARLARGDRPTDAWGRLAPAVPIVGWRREDPAGGRRACDALQAELAAWGCVAGGASPWDWAGYIVA